MICKIYGGHQLLDLPEEAAVSAVTDTYLFKITNNFNYSLKAGRHASWRSITAKVILSNITHVRKAATDRRRQHCFQLLGTALY